MVAHKAEGWVSIPGVPVTCKQWHIRPFTHCWGSQCPHAHKQRRDTNHRKQKVGCQGVGREGSGELLLNESRVSTFPDERVLETDGGDGCTTVWISLTALNCTFKNNEDGEFHVIWILSQFLKKKDVTSFRMSTWKGTQGPYEVKEGCSGAGSW